MTTVTLPNRMSLARRVNAFGGSNGRGRGGLFRFGDVASDRALVEEQLTIQQTFNSPSTRQGFITGNRVDWAALHAAYPDWARAAYASINQGALDPDSFPDIETWLARYGGSVPIIAPPPVMSLPVAPPAPTPAITPGMTDAEYQAALAAAQSEADRLATLAQERHNAFIAEAKRVAADEAAKEYARTTGATPVKPKSVLPWVLAAGAALLLLKG